MGYYLMIKEAEEIGVKYLCKCMDNRDPYEYKGSGVFWRKIINKHNSTIKTIILGHYDTSEKLRKAGEYYSDKFDIVHKREWANLIPEIGDGGSTTKGKIRCYNPITKEERLLDKLPKNWIRGSQYSPAKGKIRCHNPITKKYKLVNDESKIPAGWIKGGLKGVYNYGPKKGVKVYSDGKRKYYLHEGDSVPEEYILGIGKEGSTKGRIGYYNPFTKKKIYLKSTDNIPEGWIKGIFPTTGKKIKTPFGIFNSIAECMRELSLNRYKIKCHIKKLNDWNYINE